MIRGNAMDVYEVSFDNGEKFSLMARNKTIALLTAHEMVPDHAIVAVHKVDEWEDDHA